MNLCLCYSLEGTRTQEMNDSPSVLLGGVLQHLEFPCRHRARADVAHLSALHHVIQRLHDFFIRRPAVQAMDLQHVNVRPQPLHACIHGVEDMFAAQAHLIYHIAVVGGHQGDARLGAGLVDSEVAFGKDDEF